MDFVNRSRNGSFLNVSQDAYTHPVISRLVVDIWLSVLMICSIISTYLLILLLYVILSQKRTASDVYVVNLLFNHLFTVAIGQPIDLFELYLAFIGIDDHIYCPAWEFFRRGAGQTDLWASLFLALNRFNAVHFPLHYKWWTHKTTVTAVIAASWFMGTVVVLPPALGIAGTFHKIPPWYTCTVKFVNTAWTTALITIGATIPMASAGIVYGLFSLGVLLDKIRGRKAASAQKINMIKIALMLAASYLFLMACFIPYMIIAFRFQYSMTNPLVFLWVTGLQFLGSCGNPVIFFALNADYRMRALQLFHKKAPPRARTPATVRSLEMLDQKPRSVGASVEKT